MFIKYYNSKTKKNIYIYITILIFDKVSVINYNFVNNWQI